MPPKISMTANESTTLREESEIDVSPRRFRLGTFSSLRHLNFRYLWFGTLFMSGGQWIQQVTLGWLLYDLTGSSVLLGLTKRSQGSTLPYRQSDRRRSR